MRREEKRREENGREENEKRMRREKRREQGRKGRREQRVSGGGERESKPGIRSHRLEIENVWEKKKKKSIKNHFF